MIAKEREKNLAKENIQQKAEKIREKKMANGIECRGDFRKYVNIACT